MMEYKVNTAEAADLDVARETLELMVENDIAAGWVPAGSFTAMIKHDPDWVSIFYVFQPMVKFADHPLSNAELAAMLEDAGA